MQGTSSTAAQQLAIFPQLRERSRFMSQLHSTTAQNANFLYYLYPCKRQKIKIKIKNP
jgi:hypothetical protein